MRCEKEQEQVSKTKGKGSGWLLRLLLQVMRLVRLSVGQVPCVKYARAASNEVSQRRLALNMERLHCRHRSFACSCLRQSLRLFLQFGSDGRVYAGHHV